MSGHSGEYREIFVKAVVARGDKGFRRIHRLTADHTPEEILGSKVVNHKYTARFASDSAVCDGQYTIHVWYSYGEGSQTGILAKTVQYQAMIPVEHLDSQPWVGTPLVYVHAAKAPYATDTRIDDKGSINVTVEDHWYAEVITETKLCVKVYPEKYLDLDHEKEEDDSDWELPDSELYDEDAGYDDDEVDAEDEVRPA